MENGEHCDFTVLRNMLIRCVSEGVSCVWEGVVCVRERGGGG